MQLSSFASRVSLLSALVLVTVFGQDDEGPDGGTGAAPTRRDFCVIGAGPAGVQTAFFLERLGMDYVALERSHHAGSFFDYYPRQRRLISINKVHTGHGRDAEFNLRHDWNSLLSVGLFDNAGFVRPNASSSSSSGSLPPPLLFKEYSSEYYPNAQLIPQYLDDFVARNKLNILFGHRVVSIARRRRTTGSAKTDASSSGSTCDGTESKKPRFPNPPFVVYVSVEPPGRQHFASKPASRSAKLDKVFECNVILLAAGRAEPRTARSKGADLLDPYHKATNVSSDYKNQDVLIFGMGNSALELTHAIENWAGSVHLAARNPMPLAFQTHYVGHPRALNLGILDRYQLKSLDVLLAGKDKSIDRLWFSKDLKTGRLLVNDVQDEKNQVIRMEVNPFRKGYDRIVTCLGFFWDAEIFPPNVSGIVDTHKRLKNQARKVAETSLLRSSLSDAASCGEPPSSAAAAGKSSFVVEEQLDPIGLQQSKGNVFPVTASNYESSNVPDVFPVGSLAHFRDFKKSSGGFIHGFRYTIRHIIYALRERYLGVPYPTQTVGPTSSQSKLVDELAEHLVTRFANVSSLYQLQGVYCDAFILHTRPSDKKGGSGGGGGDAWFEFVPDIPLDQIRSKRPNATNIRALREAQAVFTVSLEFGPYFQGVGVLYHQGQEETEARKREKKQWDDSNDPDLTVGTTSPPVPAVDNTPAPRPGVTEDWIESLKPLEPFTAEKIGPDGKSTSDKNVRSKFGNQFLHPVLRLWKRGGKKSSSSADIPPLSIVSEERMREEVHNEWSLPEYHIKPLKAYLATVVKEMKRRD